MVGERDALLAYLRAPGFRRLWPLVRDKLQRLDRVGGRLTLSDMDADERLALEGLLGVNLHGKRDCIVQLRRLDEALQRTRFEVSLDECMTFLYPGFVTHREAREADVALWEAFCQWSQGAVTHPLVLAWVRSLATGEGVGYRTYRECFEEYTADSESESWLLAVFAIEALMSDSSELAHCDWKDSGASGVGEDSGVSGAGEDSGVLARSLGKRTRLPVFAAQVTGDAHGLDRNNRVGRMFFWGLAALEQRNRGSIVDYEDGEALALDSESVRNLYLNFGLVLDDISSIVWVAGLPGVALHPMALTLWAADKIDGLRLSDARSDVYVVENPSIFGALIDAADGRELPHPLICPSGQPSLAALRLLDELAGAGAVIHYSGDFDVAGLQIAAALATRYADAFIPWRMGADDYEGALARRFTEADGLRENADGLRDAARRWVNRLPMLSVTEIVRLSRTTLSWESPGSGTSLTDAMTRAGSKVFQEHLVDELCQDYWE